MKKRNFCPLREGEHVPQCPIVGDANELHLKCLYKARINRAKLHDANVDYTRAPGVMQNTQLALVRREISASVYVLGRCIFSSNCAVIIL